MGRRAACGPEGALDTHRTAPPNARSASRGAQLPLLTSVPHLKQRQHTDALSSPLPPPQGVHGLAASTPVPPPSASRDGDTVDVVLARTFFDVKEYRRCAHALEARACRCCRCAYVLALRCL